MSKVEGLPSPEYLAKQILIRRLSCYYGGHLTDPKACACIGALQCTDTACPVVWEYWLTGDRMLKLLHLAVSAGELHID